MIIPMCGCAANMQPHLTVLGAIQQCQQCLELGTWVFFRNLNSCFSVGGLEKQTHHSSLSLCVFGITLKMYLPIYMPAGYSAEWHMIQPFLLQPIAIQMGEIEKSFKGSLLNAPVQLNPAFVCRRYDQHALAQSIRALKIRGFVHFGCEWSRKVK